MNIQHDLSVIKARQQMAWSAGDCARVDVALQIVGETLCEVIDLSPNARVLDVAAGHGNATLAAARRFAEVTSTDYVPGLLDASKRRAEAQGLDNITYQVADAEALPFEDGSFDVVLSTFGVMFAPDQPGAAWELLRVTRKGGTIALANWTAEGFIGQVLDMLRRHQPAPPGVRPPTRWGSAQVLGSLFGDAVEDIVVTPRVFTFRFRSVAQFMDLVRTHYGPIIKTFEALGPEGAALEAELLALFHRFNRATDGSFVAPSLYAEVIVTK